MGPGERKGKETGHERNQCGGRGDARWKPRAPSLAVLSPCEVASNNRCKTSSPGSSSSSCTGKDKDTLSTSSKARAVGGSNSSVWPVENSGSFDRSTGSYRERTQNRKTDTKSTGVGSDNIMAHRSSTSTSRKWGWSPAAAAPGKTSSSANSTVSGARSSVRGAGVSNSLAEAWRGGNFTDTARSDSSAARPASYLTQTYWIPRAQAAAPPRVTLPSVPTASAGATRRAPLSAAMELAEEASITVAHTGIRSAEVSHAKSAVAARTSAFPRPAVPAENSERWQQPRANRFAPPNKRVSQEQRTVKDRLRRNGFNETAPSAFWSGNYRATAGTLRGELSRRPGSPGGCAVAVAAHAVANAVAQQCRRWGSAQGFAAERDGISQRFARAKKKEVDTGEPRDRPTGSLHTASDRVAAARGDSVLIDSAVETFRTSPGGEEKTAPSAAAARNGGHQAAAAPVATAFSTPAGATAPPAGTATSGTMAATRTTALPPTRPAGLTFSQGTYNGGAMSPRTDVQGSCNSVAPTAEEAGGLLLGGSSTLQQRREQPQKEDEVEEPRNRGKEIEDDKRPPHESGCMSVPEDAVVRTLLSCCRRIESALLEVYFAQKRGAYPQIQRQMVSEVAESVYETVGSGDGNSRSVRDTPNAEYVIKGTRPALFSAVTEVPLEVVDSKHGDGRPSKDATFTVVTERADLVSLGELATGLWLLQSEAEVCGNRCNQKERERGDAREQQEEEIQQEQLKLTCEQKQRRQLQGQQRQEEAEGKGLCAVATAIASPAQSATASAAQEREDALLSRAPAAAKDGVEEVFVSADAGGAAGRASTATKDGASTTATPPVAAEADVGAEGEATVTATQPGTAKRREVSVSRVCAADFSGETSKVTAVDAAESTPVTAATNAQASAHSMAAADEATAVTMRGTGGRALTRAADVSAEATKEVLPVQLPQEAVKGTTAATAGGCTLNSEQLRQVFRVMYLVDGLSQHLARATRGASPSFCSAHCREYYEAISDTAAYLKGSPSSKDAPRHSSNSSSTRRASIGEGDCSGSSGGTAWNSEPTPEFVVAAATAAAARAAAADRRVAHAGASVVQPVFTGQYQEGLQMQERQMLRNGSPQPEKKKQDASPETATSHPSVAEYLLKMSLRDCLTLPRSAVTLLVGLLQVEPTVLRLPHNRQKLRFAMQLAKKFLELNNTSNSVPSAGKRLYPAMAASMTAALPSATGRSCCCSSAAEKECDKRNVSTCAGREAAAGLPPTNRLVSKEDDEAAAAATAAAAASAAAVDGLACPGEKTSAADEKGDLQLENVGSSKTGSRLLPFSTQDEQGVKALLSQLYEDIFSTVDQEETCLAGSAADSPATAPIEDSYGSPGAATIVDDATVVAEYATSSAGVGGTAVLGVPGLLSHESAAGAHSRVHTRAAATQTGATASFVKRGATDVFSDVSPLVALEAGAAGDIPTAHTEEVITRIGAAAEVDTTAATNVSVAAGGDSAVAPWECTVVEQAQRRLAGLPNVFGAKNVFPSSLFAYLPYNPSIPAQQHNVLGGQSRVAEGKGLSRALVGAASTFSYGALWTEAELEATPGVPAATASAFIAPADAGLYLPSQNHPGKISRSNKSLFASSYAARLSSASLSPLDVSASFRSPTPPPATTRLSTASSPLQAQPAAVSVSAATSSLMPSSAEEGGLAAFLGGFDLLGGKRTSALPSSTDQVLAVKPAAPGKVSPAAGQEGTATAAETRETGNLANASRSVSESGWDVLSFLGIDYSAPSSEQSRGIAGESVLQQQQQTEALEGSSSLSILAGTNPVATARCEAIGTRGGTVTPLAAGKLAPAPAAFTAISNPVGTFFSPRVHQRTSPPGTAAATAELQCGSERGARLSRDNNSTPNSSSRPGFLTSDGSHKTYMDWGATTAATHTDNISQFTCETPAFCASSCIPHPFADYQGAYYDLDNSSGSSSLARRRSCGGRHDMGTSADIAAAKNVGGVGCRCASPRSPWRPRGFCSRQQPLCGTSASPSFLPSSYKIEPDLWFSAPPGGRDEGLASSAFRHGAAGVDTVGAATGFFFAAGADFAENPGSAFYAAADVSLPNLAAEYGMQLALKCEPTATDCRQDCIFAPPESAQRARAARGLNARAPSFVPTLLARRDWRVSALSAAGMAAALHRRTIAGWSSPVEDAITSRGFFLQSVSFLDHCNASSASANTSSFASSYGGTVHQEVPAPFDETHLRDKWNVGDMRPLYLSCPPSSKEHHAECAATTAALPATHAANGWWPPRWSHHVPSGFPGNNREDEPGLSPSDEIFKIFKPSCINNLHPHLMLQDSGSGDISSGMSSHCSSSNSSSNSNSSSSSSSGRSSSRICNHVCSAGAGGGRRTGRYAAGVYSAASAGKVDQVVTADAAAAELQQNSQGEQHSEQSKSCLCLINPTPALAPSSTRVAASQRGYSAGDHRLPLHSEQPQSEENKKQRKTQLQQAGQEKEQHQQEQISSILVDSSLSNEEDQVIDCGYLTSRHCAEQLDCFFKETPPEQSSILSALLVNVSPAQAAQPDAPQVASLFSVGDSAPLGDSLAAAADTADAAVTASERDVCTDDHDAVFTSAAACPSWGWDVANALQQALQQGTTSFSMECSSERKFGYGDVESSSAAVHSPSNSTGQSSTGSAAEAFSAASEGDSCKKLLYVQDLKNAAADSTSHSSFYSLFGVKDIQQHTCDAAPSYRNYSFSGLSAGERPGGAAETNRHPAAIGCAATLRTKEASLAEKLFESALTQGNTDLAVAGGAAKSAFDIGRGSTRLCSEEKNWVSCTAMPQIAWSEAATVAARNAGKTGLLGQEFETAIGEEEQAAPTAESGPEAQNGEDAAGGVTAKNAGEEEMSESKGGVVQPVARETGWKERATNTGAGQRVTTASAAMETTKPDALSYAVVVNKDSHRGYSGSKWQPRQHAAAPATETPSAPEAAPGESFTCSVVLARPTKIPTKSSTNSHSQTLRPDGETDAAASPALTSASAGAAAQPPGADRGSSVGAAASPLGPVKRLPARLWRNIDCSVAELPHEKLCELVVDPQALPSDAQLGGSCRPKDCSGASPRKGVDGTEEAASGTSAGAIGQAPRRTLEDKEGTAEKHEAGEAVEGAATATAVEAEFSAPVDACFSTGILASCDFARKSPGRNEGAMRDTPTLRTCSSRKGTASLSREREISKAGTFSRTVHHGRRHTAAEKTSNFQEGEGAEGKIAATGQHARGAEGKETEKEEMEVTGDSLAQTEKHSAASVYDDEGEEVTGGGDKLGEKATETLSDKGTEAVEEACVWRAQETVDNECEGPRRRKAHAKDDRRRGRRGVSWPGEGAAPLFKNCDSASANRITGQRKPACCYYMRGKCDFTSMCIFWHPASPKNFDEIVCKYGRMCHVHHGSRVDDEEMARILCGFARSLTSVADGVGRAVHCRRGAHLSGVLATSTGNSCGAPATFSSSVFGPDEASAGAGEPLSPDAPATPVGAAVLAAVDCGHSTAGEKPASAAASRTAAGAAGLPRTNSCAARTVHSTKKTSPENPREKTDTTDGDEDAGATATNTGESSTNLCSGKKEETSSSIKKGFGSGGVPSTKAAASMGSLPQDVVERLFLLRDQINGEDLSAANCVWRRVHGECFPYSKFGFKKLRHAIASVPGISLHPCRSRIFIHFYQERQQDHVQRQCHPGVTCLQCRHSISIRPNAMEKKRVLVALLSSCESNRTRSNMSTSTSSTDHTTRRTILSGEALRDPGSCGGNRSVVSSRLYSCSNWSVHDDCRANINTTGRNSGAASVVGLRLRTIGSVGSKESQKEEMKEINSDVSFPQLHCAVDLSGSNKHICSAYRRVQKERKLTAAATATTVIVGKESSRSRLLGEASQQGAESVASGQPPKAVVSVKPNYLQAAIRRSEAPQRLYTPFRLHELPPLLLKLSRQQVSGTLCSPALLCPACGFLLHSPVSHPKCGHMICRDCLIILSAAHFWTHHRISLKHIGTLTQQQQLRGDTAGYSGFSAANGTTSHCSVASPHQQQQADTPSDGPRAGQPLLRVMSQLLQLYCSPAALPLSAQSPGAPAFCPQCTYDAPAQVASSEVFTLGNSTRERILVSASSTATSSIAGRGATANNSCSLPLIKEDTSFSTASVVAEQRVTSRNTDSVTEIGETSDGTTRLANGHAAIETKEKAGNHQCPVETEASKGGKQEAGAQRSVTKAARARETVINATDIPRTTETKSSTRSSHLLWALGLRKPMMPCLLGQFVTVSRVNSEVPASIGSVLGKVKVRCSWGSSEGGTSKTTEGQTGGSEEGIRTITDAWGRQRQVPVSESSPATEKRVQRGSSSTADTETHSGVDAGNADAPRRHTPSDIIERLRQSLYVQYRIVSPATTSCSWTGEYANYLEHLSKHLTRPHSCTRLHGTALTAAARPTDEPKQVAEEGEITVSSAS